MQDGGGGVADGVGGYRERPRDFLPLVRALGIHFQVRDDYVNLSSGAVRPRDVHVAPHLNLNAQHRLSLSLCVSLSMAMGAQYMAHKGFCEDITEGKFSLPVIHAVRSQPTNHQLLSKKGARAWAPPTLRLTAPLGMADILKQKTDNVEVVTYALKVIRDAGSLQYTVGVLRHYEQLARREVERLGANAAVLLILDTLSEVYRDAP
jgi:geranylgeranyl diphosphate synthase, type III